MQNAHCSGHCWKHYKILKSRNSHWWYWGVFWYEEREREREGWSVWWWGVWSLPRAHPLIHFDQLLSFWKKVEWWTWRWWHYDESMMFLLKLFVPVKSWWWSTVNVGVTSVTLSQLILEATPIDWVLISCELSWKGGGKKKKSKNTFLGSNWGQLTGDYLARLR